MAALAVIGAIGTALGLITWTLDRFPSQPPKNSLLRVGLGLNDGSVNNAGGYSPDVWAYDALGNEIGRTTEIWIGRPIIDDGNFDDITIFHVADKERTQSQYILVEGDVSGDLICIAYMTLTWADGGRHGWNGDLGRLCGEKWYPSNVVIGESYKPACTWIGYNEPDGVAYGVTIDMVAVSPSTGDSLKDASYYCDHQRYHHSTTSRHRSRQSRNRFSSSIIISESDQHNGTSNELCTSPTSYGPSFVSLAEHAFCDMETKQLWPLCDSGFTDDGACFDLDTYTLRGAEKLHRRSFAFTTVDFWD